VLNKAVPFREAYKTVGEQIERGDFNYDYSKGLNHTHEGSIGNLGNDQISKEMDKVIRKFEGS
jgi:argininosuccinate lyase